VILSLHGEGGDGSAAATGTEKNRPAAYEHVVIGGAVC